MTKHIFSAASPAGRSLFDSLDGIDHVSPDRCLANPGPLLDGVEDTTTNATSGPSSSASSKPVGRRSSSASKSRPAKSSDDPAKDESESLSARLAKALAKRIDLAGSMEYALIWKRHILPSGQSIYRLRASGRRTSDRESSGSPETMAGWHTPDTSPDSPCMGSNCSTTVAGLGNQAKAIIGGWPTPDRSSGEGGRTSKDPLAKTRPSGAKKQLTINDAAQMAGWGTPKCSDGTMSETTSIPPSGTRSRLELEVLIINENSGHAISVASGTIQQSVRGGSKTAGRPESTIAQSVATGWATPMATDGDKADCLLPGVMKRIKEGKQISTAMEARLTTGWATPTTRDSKDGACQDANVPVNGLLGRQAAKLVSPPPSMLGETTNSSSAEMASTGESRGSLNPSFSLCWLMGYPKIWLVCGLRAAMKPKPSRKKSAPTRSRKKKSKDGPTS
jgi:hypothetical protein